MSNRGWENPRSTYSTTLTPAPCPPDLSSPGGRERRKKRLRQRSNGNGCGKEERKEARTPEVMKLVDVVLFV